MMIRKKKAILDRIKRLEDTMAKANEYLASGKHAHRSGFRPLLHLRRGEERIAATQRMGQERIQGEKGVDQGRESPRKNLNGRPLKGPFRACFCTP
jgi:hypothetical protein